MLVSGCEDSNAHYFIVQELKSSGNNCSGSLGALGSTNGFIKAASMNKPSFILRIASERTTVRLIIAVSCGQDFFLYFNHKQQKYQPVWEIKLWLLKRKMEGGGQKSGRGTAGVLKYKSAVRRVFGGGVTGSCVLVSGNTRKIRSSGVSLHQPVLSFSPSVDKLKH